MYYMCEILNPCWKTEALSLDALTHRYIYHSYIILGIRVSPFPLLHTVPCGQTNKVRASSATYIELQGNIWECFCISHLLVNPIEYVSENTEIEQSINT